MDIIKSAIIAGAIALIISTINMIPASLGIVSLNVALIAIGIPFSIVWYLGLAKVGEHFKIELLKKISHISIFLVPIFGFITILSLLYNNLTLGLVEIVIVGLIHIVTGIAFRRMRKVPWANETGILLIISGILLASILFSFIYLILIIPVSILEIIIVYRSHQIIKHGKEYPPRQLKIHKRIGIPIGFIIIIILGAISIISNLMSLSTYYLEMPPLEYLGVYFSAIPMYTIAITLFLVQVAWIIGIIKRYKWTAYLIMGQFGVIGITLITATLYKLISNIDFNPVAILVQTTIALIIFAYVYIKRNHFKK